MEDPDTGGGGAPAAPPDDAAPARPAADAAVPPPGLDVGTAVPGDEKWEGKRGSSIGGRPTTEEKNRIMKTNLLGEK